MAVWHIEQRKQQWYIWRPVQNKVQSIITSNLPSICDHAFTKLQIIQLQMPHPENHKKTKLGAPTRTKRSADVLPMDKAIAG